MFVYIIDPRILNTFKFPALVIIKAGTRHLPFSALVFCQIPLELLSGFVFTNLRHTFATLNTMGKGIDIAEICGGEARTTQVGTRRHMSHRRCLNFHLETTLCYVHVLGIANFEARTGNGAIPVTDSTSAYPCRAHKPGEHWHRTRKPGVCRYPGDEPWSPRCEGCRKDKPRKRKYPRDPRVPVSSEPITGSLGTPGERRAGDR